MMKPTLREGIIALGGMVTGAGIGYFVAAKRAEARLAEHLNAMDEVYEDAIARALKTGKYSDVNTAAATLVPEEATGLETDDVEGPNYDADYDDELKEDDQSEESVEDIQNEEEALDEAEEPHTPRHARTNYVAPKETELLQQYQPTADDEDPQVRQNLAEFVDRFRNRPAPSGGVTYPGKDDEVETPTSSVPDWQTVRDPNGPYLISIDEYMEEDGGAFTKVEMTYFDGDHVLIDINEQVSELSVIGGDKHLDSWGQGTTDKDQMYIRNERLGIDIEVTRDEGTYSRAVLGIIPDEELRRAQTKPQRMRDGDDD